MKLFYGNQLIAQAAIDAGASFCAAYPITPATTIIESYLKQTTGKEDYVFIQCEDEIAALHAAIGGSIGGRKSFTATSGPGFSLMQEGIGLAFAADIPLVVINVMRQGPSTGMPTKASQGDILQTQYGTHGDFKSIVFYPSSLEEMYSLTMAAFNAAEISNSPVIILLDAVLASLFETIDLDKCSDRYNGGSIPHKLKFGDSNRHFTGLVSDETGIPQTNDTTYYKKWLKRKYDGIYKAASYYEYYDYHYTENNRVLIISFGIVSRFIKTSEKYDTFKPLRLFPICNILQEISSRYERIIVIEMNQGQYTTALRSYLGRAIEAFCITYEDLHEINILGDVI